MITGATSGIGRALASKLQQLGNQVIVCGRRPDRLAQLAEQHPGIKTRTCDVSVPQEREALWEWVQEKFPETNILINNAGIQLVADLMRPVNMERIRSEVEINFIAPLHLASLFSGMLSAQTRSAIVNISSGLAFAPIAFMPVYCATKAAIHSLTLSLRHQLKDTAVQVFEIIPPSVDTELGQERRPDNQSHGGMELSIFTDLAIAALQNDQLEATIGQSAWIRGNPDEAFRQMNR